MKRRIYAADEEFDHEFSEEEPEIVDDDSFGDELDDLADSVEDLKDQVDDVDEDEVAIELDNNIDGHYIAECDRCHGVFISAVVESDQQVEKISGVCPLCDKDTDQYLKWIIKSVESR